MGLPTADRTVDDEEWGRPAGATAFETGEPSGLAVDRFDPASVLALDVVRAVLDDPPVGSVGRLTVESSGAVSAPGLFIARGALGTGRMAGDDDTSLAERLERMGDQPTDRESPDEFRLRMLERVCARRASLTVVFILSGMMLVVSLALLGFADMSRGSTVVAAVDALVSGGTCVASLVVLRRCNRLRRGE